MGLRPHFYLIEIRSREHATVRLGGVAFAISIRHPSSVNTVFDGRPSHPKAIDVERELEMLFLSTVFDTQNAPAHCLQEPPSPSTSPDQIMNETNIDRQ